MVPNSLPHTGRTSRTVIIISVLLLLLIVGCASADQPTETAEDKTASATAAVIVTAATNLPLEAHSDAQTAIETLTPQASLKPGPELPPETPSPTTTPTQTLTPTPVYTGPLSPPCGQALPLVTSRPVERDLPFDPDANLRGIVQNRLPTAARPAFQELLNHPARVGLVAFRMGEEDQGVRLNADTPMPLASVGKIIHLIAYVEAVEAGQLDPQQPIPLEELNRFDLPGSNARSHQNALRALENEGKISASETILLADIVEMMIRFSSNAATDYIHFLIGQAQIEETARRLGLQSHTAPCPFLAQFLAISNHTRTEGDGLAIQRYINAPADYAAESMFLADAYINSAEFRAAEGRWRGSLTAQRTFVDQLSPHASAADYARLMFSLAQNGLTTPESSFQARRYIEWPMRFEVNQTLFENLGYKDGFLPGVLTTAYYGYPKGETVPVIVVLFYRDLPNDTYRRWRTQLAHDEFARWFLTDPEAIVLMNSLLRSTNDFDN